MSSGLPHLPDTVWDEDKNISPSFTYSMIRSCSRKFIHCPPKSRNDTRWQLRVDASSTLICSSRAVRREMRCVSPGFVRPCCPSFVELQLRCTICWASSSQRLRSSVGWSAGTMPWSGASCMDTAVIRTGNKALSSFFSSFWNWDVREIRTWSECLELWSCPLIQNK